MKTIIITMLLAVATAVAQDWGSDPAIPKSQCFTRSEQLTVWVHSVRLEWRRDSGHKRPQVSIRTYISASDRNYGVQVYNDGRPYTSTLTVSWGPAVMKQLHSQGVDPIYGRDGGPVVTVQLEPLVSGEPVEVDRAQWQRTWEKYARCMDKHWHTYLVDPETGGECE